MPNMKIGLNYENWSEKDDFETKWRRFKNYCSSELRLPKADGVGVEVLISEWFESYYSGRINTKNIPQDKINTLKRAVSIVNRAEKTGGYREMDDFFLRN
ncbi:hypothetical protein FACS1894105_08130 [Clostridia bacterium]|nr:hypothetical protein FACS1894105_08130 [Clostridia bacterium]GHV11250.1 hypothetical protein FACS1894219_02100 [Clostridia bacterium]